MRGSDALRHGTILSGRSGSESHGFGPTRQRSGREGPLPASLEVLRQKQAANSRQGTKVSRRDGGRSLRHEPRRHPNSSRSATRTQAGISRGSRGTLYGNALLLGIGFPLIGGTGQGGSNFSAGAATRGRSL